MTPKEIIENNIMIAEFMGGKTSDKSRLAVGHQNIWLPFHGICRWDTIDLGKGKIIKYHCNWNWLMPVVEKIEEIHKSDPVVYVVINGHGCEISYMVNHNWPEDRDVIVDIGYPEAQSKIESVWKAVVKFIEHYNENTSSLQST